MVNVVIVDDGVVKGDIVIIVWLGVVMFGVIGL